MQDAPFVTSHLDVALTRLAAGRDVLYLGPHQGVFRFESVKLAALKARRARVERRRRESGAEAALRAFFAEA